MKINGTVWRRQLYTLSQICLSVAYDATSDICFGFRRLFVSIVGGGIVIFNTPHHYFFNIHPFTSCPCPSGQTFVAENKYCEPSKFANFTLRAGWLSSTVWLFSSDEMENCRNTKNPPPSTSGGSVTSSAHRQQFWKFFKLGKNIYKKKQTNKKVTRSNKHSCMKTSP
ncbi:hypothetical protein T02_2330 [Trichinella nativa]|uniref:Uncharacterized protein n=1 Tax=Trichinella nativa TaxID=6335 RepID=A0A0V1KVP9_9BILA|nr:hypothetical protein T02_2330 [Trichinella nativa]